MTPEQFCYWFQGFAELSPEPPTPAQWQAIRDHLATVFKKVTPKISDEELRRMFEQKPQPGAIRQVLYEWPYKPVDITC